MGEFDHLKPIIEQLPSTLSADEVKRVIASLQQNVDVFCRHKFDLECTDLVQVRIPTGDAQPFTEGLRSHPRAYLEAIDNEIEQLRKAHVIEDACSSWSSNIVCVK
jgi:hypothetical protein